MSATQGMAGIMPAVDSDTLALPKTYAKNVYLYGKAFKYHLAALLPRAPYIRVAMQNYGLAFPCVLR